MKQIWVELRRASLPFVLTPDGLFRLANPEAFCPGRLYLVEYLPFDQFATIVALALDPPVRASTSRDRPIRSA